MAARKTRPALTPEAQESRLTSLAMTEAEKRIRDGTASSQLLIEFIKRASPKHQQEIEKLRHENELLKAKTKALENAEEQKVLYEQALRAMRNYSGMGNDADDEY